MDQRPFVALLEGVPILLPFQHRQHSRCFSPEVLYVALILGPEIGIFGLGDLFCLAVIAACYDYSYIPDHVAGKVSENIWIFRRRQFG